MENRKRKSNCGWIMRAISAASCPWQRSYYPIPKNLHTQNLSLHSSNYHFPQKTHSINKSILTLYSCSNEQESRSKNPRNYQDLCEKNQSFFDEFYSSIEPPKCPKIEDLETADIDCISCSLGIAMGWTELKAALGQRINLEGIACSLGVFARDNHLVIPHVFVPDIRHINWAELKSRGFNGVVFDKDNTLTVPYSLSLWPPLRSSVEECKSHFGNNVAVFSNSAGNSWFFPFKFSLFFFNRNAISIFFFIWWILGLYEYDIDDKKASALENAIGIKVIRHGMFSSQLLVTRIHFNIQVLIRCTVFLLEWQMRYPYLNFARDFSLGLYRCEKTSRNIWRNWKALLLWILKADNGIKWQLLLTVVYQPPVIMFDNILVPITGGWSAIHWRCLW